MKKSDLLRNQERCEVLGYELDRATLLPVRREFAGYVSGEVGSDPLGNGMFRMVPSGDIVDLAERNRRLVKR